MAADSSERGDRLLGAAGVVMAICCLAGPAVLGAAAGAAIGNLVGIAGATVVAAALVFVIRRWRHGRAC